MRVDGEMRALDGDLTGDDPAAAYRLSADAARQALAAPGAMEATCHLSFGDFPGADSTPAIVAVSGPTRSPFLPDAPTLKEAGVDIVADGWYGMWLPAGSSPEFARKLSAAAAEVLAKPDVKERLNAVTLIPVGSTPEDLTKALAADTAFWQPIVKATGYKITN